MKIKDYINTYEEFTSLTSTVARQLIFSGIALIWLFKIDKDGDFILSIELLKPTLALIIALSLDLFQYITASIIWYCFYRYHEEKSKNDPSFPLGRDITSPLIFTYLINGIFISKIIAVITAYYYLFIFTIANIKFIP